MGAHLIRRMLINVAVFVVISVLIFWAVHLAPGDPIAMLVPPDELNSGSAAMIAAQRHALGLDRPLPVQYWHWLGGLLHGDLGYSLVNGRPVGLLLGTRIGPTVELMGAGMLLSLVIAFPLGIVSAVRRGTAVDHAATTISLGAVSIPVFYLGLIAIYVFTLRFPLLPSSGMSDPAAPGFADSVRHLVLPAVILGFGNSGPLVRHIRGSMITELGGGYVRTAEAKGATRARVVLGHSLRNSLIPVLTVIATNLPQLLAGAVVIEQVFAWPGMGQLALSSVQAHDYPVIIGFALLIAVLVLLSNLLADVVYTVVDPRVRLR